MRDARTLAHGVGLQPRLQKKVAKKKMNSRQRHKINHDQNLRTICNRMTVTAFKNNFLTFAGPKQRPVAMSTNSAGVGFKYWSKKVLKPPPRFF
jgi:hypothetical protein